MGIHNCLTPKSPKGDFYSVQDGIICALFICGGGDHPTAKPIPPPSCRTHRRDAQLGRLTTWASCKHTRHHKTIDLSGQKPYPSSQCHTVAGLGGCGHSFPRLRFANPGL
jgi:hypothetical protein